MNRRIMAVALAVVLALAGTFAVLTYVKGADRRAVAGQQPVEVFVAQKQVPAGTTAKQAVADRLIAKQVIARKGVPEGALTQVSDASGSLVATSDIEAGSVVMSSRVGAQVATQEALTIPSGQMAVALELGDPARVGSFLRVGSEVAIFDTFNVQEADSKDMTPAGDHISDRHEYTRATRLLLPRVTVLGLGESTSKSATPSSMQNTANTDSKTEATNSGSTAGVQTQLVTVAVDQSQAEKLIHGIQTGTLYFALLNGDSDVAPRPGVDDRRLFATR